MNKEWVVLYYIHYGDDWETEYKEVFECEDDAISFEYEHRKEHKDVAGINYIEFYYDYASEKMLRGKLTVNEYIQLFPDVEELLNNRLGNCNKF